MPLVFWDRVCIPKKYQGLNIKGCGNWNVASVGKLIWQLTLKEDYLWVKQVHRIYIKTTINIQNPEAPLDSSQYWRKLNTLKNKIREWSTQG